MKSNKKGLEKIKKKIQNFERLKKIKKKMDYFVFIALFLFGTHILFKSTGVMTGLMDVMFMVFDMLLILIMVLFISTRLKVYWIYPVTILMLIGGMMNLTAVVTNDFKMPVESDGIGLEEDTRTHFYFDDKSEINNYFLVDRFDVGFGVASIGDLISFLALLFCLGVFIFGAVKIWRLKRNDWKD